MSMTEKEMIKKRKEYFRPNAIPTFPIELTHPIIIEETAYQIVGQRIGKSPLFTHYIVIDELENEARPDISEKVYTYIAMFQLTELLLALIPKIEAQEIDFAKNEVRELMTDFKNQTGINIETTINNKQIIDLLTNLQTEIDNISKSDEFTVNNFKLFEQAWDTFWHEYEHRMPVVLAFRNYILDQTLLDEQIPNGLQQLYDEAKQMYQLFYETIPTDPVHLKSIRQFIVLNAELGRIEQTDHQAKILNKFEQFSYIFFRQILYLIVILGAIIFMIIDGYRFILVFNTVMLLLLSGFAHLANTLSIKNTIIRRTKQRREQLMTEHLTTRELFQKAYTPSEGGEQTAKRIEIQTVTARNAILTSTTGGIMLTTGLIMMIDSPYPTFSTLLATFGFILMIGGIFLPKQTKFKRKLMLEDTGITYGRQTIELDHLIKISTKKGKKYELYGAKRHEPIEIRIAKENKQQAKREIKSWCERHLITFEE